MTCLITGCAFHDPETDRALWGDLHHVGDCWVFNGATVGGKPQWQYGEDARVPDVTKTLTLNPGTRLGDFVEKGAVLVIQKSAATLNKAAIDYIKPRPY